MKPDKILYVDDEPVALKYFERLVGPMAQVLTATSVKEGRVLLQAHAAEIAVLVCDQRMPGERGTELLRHARTYYPGIVRMMTTAYSELGEAIDAINTGEIYRYISKPWELENLRADLKNALELAELRAERDMLAKDKLLAQQSQLMAQRLASVVALGAAWLPGRYEAALWVFTQSALSDDLKPPAVDWTRWDHADLVQAEARRSVALADSVQACWQRWGAKPGGGVGLPVLAQALGLVHQEDTLRLTDSAPLNAWLTGAPGATPDPAAIAWLAWLLAQHGGVLVVADASGWVVRQTPTWPDVPVDWLAGAIDRMGPPPP